MVRTRNESVLDGPAATADGLLGIRRLICMQHLIDRGIAYRMQRGVELYEMGIHPYDRGEIVRITPL